MEGTLKIAVVEDNDWYRRLLKHTLELNPDFDVHIFSNGSDMLASIDGQFDVLTLDYRLPDMSGDEVLEKVHQKFPSLDVVVVSEQEDIETAVELLKGGASDYIVKSEQLKDRLLHSIERIRKHKNLEKRVEHLESEVEQRFAFDAMMVGESDDLQKVFTLIKKAIKTDINVVITGETGTGKEMVAKTIHYNSQAAKGPFVAVNIAAIPSELIESELFGHVKGAFTGAHQDRIGKFEQANGGTLLLDEIGEMDMAHQAKLLRVLQEKEFAQVGSNKLKKIDCRIVVATNQNLVDLVKKGDFRQDLYYRLFGVTIDLPPLRNRGKDVLLLADKFIADYCKKQDREGYELSKEASRKLMQYDYPGNVRELKSVVELAVTMSEGNTIEAGDVIFPEVPIESKLLSTVRTMRAYELYILKHFLNKYDDDVSEVARILDIGKSTIYRMMKELPDSNNDNDSQIGK